MSSDVSHAFSHILVAGTSIWCLYNTGSPGKFYFQYGIYLPACLYSLIGTWRYGNPRYGDDSRRLYDITQKILTAVSWPCFVGELYLGYRYDPQIVSLLTGCSLLPLAKYLLQNDWDQNLCDVINLAAISCGTVLTVVEENYYGLAANLNFFAIHFVLKDNEVAEVPNKVFYNVIICFCLIYAYKALHVSIV